jgi:hypothetical protein
MDRIKDLESPNISMEDNRPLMSPEWSSPSCINDGDSRVEKRRSIYTLFSSFAPALNTILLLAVLVLLVLNVSKLDEARQVETSGDFTGFFPKCKFIA